MITLIRSEFTEFIEHCLERGDIYIVDQPSLRIFRMAEDAPLYAVTWSKENKFGDYTLSLTAIGADEETALTIFMQTLYNFTGYQRRVDIEAIIRTSEQQDPTILAKRISIYLETGVMGGLATGVTDTEALSRLCTFPGGGWVLFKYAHDMISVAISVRSHHDRGYGPQLKGHVRPVSGDINAAVQALFGANALSAADLQQIPLALEDSE